MKDRWWFLMKFDITSLEYPAILTGFPPPQVQDGIWVWGWGGKMISWGQEWTGAGARSGPCGDTSGPENRLMTAETQTCWLAFGARRWHSSPEATVRLFPFLSKRLCPLMPPPTHLLSTAPHTPTQGHPVPWGHRRYPRALPKTRWPALLPAPTLSGARTPRAAPNVSASLPLSPLPSSSREAQAASLGPSGPGLSSGNTWDSSLRGGGRL